MESERDFEWVKLEERIVSFLASRIPPVGTASVARVLAEEFRTELAALEVLNANAAGTVVYIDWP